MNDYRIGEILGGYIGAAAGIYGTIRGGYELGSLINNYFEISNTLIRGLTDVGFMAVLVDPLFVYGAYCGRLVGIASETALDKIINGVRGLSDLIK